MKFLYASLIYYLLSLHNVTIDSFSKLNREESIELLREIDSDLVSILLKYFRETTEQELIVDNSKQIIQAITNDQDSIEATIQCFYKNEANKQYQDYLNQKPVIDYTRIRKEQDDDHLL